MIYNVLRYFPEDSFVILTSHVGLDRKMIEDGRRLPAKYFFFDTPRPATAPEREGSFFWRCKRFIKRFKGLRLFFHLLSLFYLPFNIVWRGKKIVKEEKIELLLGYSDHGPALISTYLLHKLTKKPFCLHFYDLYYGNNFAWFFTLAARFVEPTLFRSAERISAMSEALAEHYQTKYGREVTVLHNAIPLGSSARPGPVLVHPEPYRIVYTGTISWAQAQAIRNLVQAIQSLPSPEVVLHLYTPHEKRFLESQGIFESDQVVFARGLPREMPAIQAAADILFVGLSFDTRYPLLINTSSPGKTCEYLVSGRPILVHAPKVSYIARYARQHAFACIVDENDAQGLAQQIAKLIVDKEVVERIVSNAWKTALANHDGQKISESLRQLLFGQSARSGSPAELIELGGVSGCSPYLNHE